MIGPRRTAAFGLVVALAGGTAFSPAGAAQEAPPPPLPMEELSFPPFVEGTLSNGAGFIVVEQDEQPWVTVNLVIPGGYVSDPAGRIGVAEFAANLMTKGTGTRSAEEIAEEVDFLGATLGATAAPEWVSLTLALLSPDLEAGLELMADVVLNPVFPEDEIELFREQALAGLQAELGNPGAVAERAFLRALYGGHPYGKIATPETVRAITRDDLVAFRDAHFRPERALFVVAGAVEAAEVEGLLERRFSAWTGAPRDPPEYTSPPARAGREVVVVHKPGSVQSVVRIGHLLMEGRHEDWTALSVASQVLGGGAYGRLFRILREERGWTYGASSSLTRRPGPGHLQISAEVRNEVTDSALVEILAQLERMREEPVPVEELSDMQSFMTGSFPLQIETPQQVASRIQTNRMLGLDPGELETYRSRVASLTPEGVREVAAAHLDPESALIVVVGDAEQVLEKVEDLGEVTLLDVEGRPLSLSDLVPGGGPGFDASSLDPGEWRYRVVVQGRPLGEFQRTLERVEVEGEPAFRLTTEGELGPLGSDHRSVTFLVEGFRAVSAEMETTTPAGTRTAALEVRGDSIFGSVVAPGAGETAIARPYSSGLAVGEMQEAALWLADWSAEPEIRYPVLVGDDGSVQSLRARVLGETEVTVPAGTFQAYEIEVTGGAAPQVLALRADAPHILLRMSTGPIVLELVEGPGGGG